MQSESLHSEIEKLFVLVRENLDNLEEKASRLLLQNLQKDIYEITSNVTFETISNNIRCKIDFNINNDTIANMHIHNLKLYSLEEYEAASNSEKKFNFNYCDSNGSVEIWYDPAENDHVKFHVSKYGNGTGGEVNIRVPHKNCRNVFLEITKMLL